jgi:hypothetical protein
MNLVRVTPRVSAANRKCAREDSFLEEFRCREGGRGRSKMEGGRLLAFISSCSGYKYLLDSVIRSHEHKEN